MCADRKRELLDMMVDTLRKEDYRVFQAYDGLAALELCVSLREVDLLVTNTNMPGLNGCQLIRQVREKLPTLAILYVKNLDAPDVTPDGLPPDVPTLAEPFTPEQLLSAVRPLLVRD